MAPVPKETDKAKAERLTRQAIKNYYNPLLEHEEDATKKLALEHRRDAMLEAAKGLEQQFLATGNVAVEGPEEALNAVAKNSKDLAEAYQKKYGLKDFSNDAHLKQFNEMVHIVGAMVRQRVAPQIAPPPPPPGKKMDAPREGADSRILKAAEEYFAQTQAGRPLALTAASAPRPVAAEQEHSLSA